MLKRIMMIVFILLSYICTVRADMGRIYVSKAKVNEEGQKAIILYNLKEEVLILGTDLKADKNVGIIRFIPFPSEPKVTLAPPDAFKVAAELIKKHALKFVSQPTKGLHSQVESKSVELRFNAKLGVHDVTVIKVNNTTYFRHWVNTFFKQKGLPTNESYPDVEVIVKDYLQRGINYFVFDFVQVTDETRFVEPLLYRFKSKKIYYPLKTTNTFGGKGEIDIIIVAPVTLCDPLYGQALYIPKSEKDIYTLYPCIKPFSGNGRMKISTSANISKTELKDIYPQAGELLQENEPIFMQLIHYQGEYSFDDDILLDISKAPRTAITERNAGDKFFFGFDPVKIMPPPLVANKDFASLMLGEACLKATLTAIEMEIERFEQRIKAAKEGPGDPQNIPGFEKRIEEFDAEYEKYERMIPAYYLLPKKKTVRVKVTHAYQEGSILEINGMTRSGPFYHVAGIRGYDYESLQPGKTYQMTIYPIYPRDYPFPSYYVYIVNAKARLNLINPFLTFYETIKELKQKKSERKKEDK